MSRKDYVAIAAAIANVRTGESLAERGYITVDVVDNLAAQLADVLADGNPRFDRERFIKATQETQS